MYKYSGHLAEPAGTQVRVLEIFEIQVGFLRICGFWRANRARKISEFG